MVDAIIPNDLITKCIGAKVLILLKNREVSGTLIGYDNLFNLVLEGVTEKEYLKEGEKITKLKKILLNGSNIDVIVPGTEIES